MENASFGENIEKVVALLQKSRSVLAITGAGISADSGLPTYRGITGLYTNKKTDEGMSIEAALSGSTFQQNPKLTWKYISQIEKVCRGKSYNRGHEVLAEMEHYFDRVCILTQNVDGFHHKAGSSNVIDIHGNTLDLYCPRCKYRMMVQDYSTIDIPPICPECGNIMRPDVVLFEELLSMDNTQRLAEELRKGFDIVFSIGTTSVFPYIAQPVIDAYHNNIPTVEINPDHTEVSKFCLVKIPGTAAKTLNAIWMLFQQTRGQA